MHFEILPAGIGGGGMAEVHRVFVGSGQGVGVPSLPRNNTLLDHVLYCTVQQNSKKYKKLKAKRIRVGGGSAVVPAQQHN